MLKPDVLNGPVESEYEYFFHVKTKTTKNLLYVIFFSLFFKIKNLFSKTLYRLSWTGTECLLVGLRKKIDNFFLAKIAPLNGKIDFIKINKNVYFLQPGKIVDSVSG